MAAEHMKPNGGCVCFDVVIGRLWTLVNKG